MKLSEKQALSLMEIAQSCAIMLKANGEYEVSKNVWDLYDEIKNQQSDELKELEK
jgi:hypothetical protein